MTKKGAKQFAAVYPFMVALLRHAASTAATHQ